jgi:WhiB family redox-sensing transcriptional regulator
VVKGEDVKAFEFLPKLPHLPEAACREIENPDFFFPDSRAEERKSLKAVIEICDGCPVRKECLEYALNEQINHGLWAGTTPAQRQRMIDKKEHREQVGSRAYQIRHLDSLGYNPKEIAMRLSVEHSYVTTVLLKRKAKLEGEIQSQLANAKLGEESPSSSGFRQ